MDEVPKSGWDRRDFMGAATLLALVVGVPAATIRLVQWSADEAPTARQRMLMREVSQLILPRTATPGAGDVGVGDFVILALEHGLEKSRQPLAAEADPRLQRFRRRDGSLRHLPWLESELDNRAGRDFLGAPHAARAAALAALDAQAYRPEVREHPWRTVKALVLTGYYTSETGASRELRYETVPGRWDPDVPLKPGDRAFSSDWTAVDFG